MLDGPLFLRVAAETPSRTPPRVRRGASMEEIPSARLSGRRPAQEGSSPAADAGTTRRISGPIVRPCTTIEKTTTT